MKNTIQHNGKRLVCRIFDNGGQSLDRYTVAFRGYRVPGYGMVYPYIASSEKPFHSLGFGQHGESREFLKGQHLGQRVSFDAVPLDVQLFILDQFNG